ncbi:hypothetical protein BKA69DRAFT_1071786 [Paraphysoderma sedebokerense]|nr:hypothetical protein BKA69DRAFT_1071769 [Paraphysoderma sedebokerense]KAI9141890.1 hypothetical protein BKA69DRAFT_1071786 [Paraphysoderma sedebokerense]
MHDTSAAHMAEYDTLSDVNALSQLPVGHIEGLPLNQRRVVLIAYDDSESSDWLLQWSLDNFLREGADHAVIATVLNEENDMAFAVKAFLNEDKVRNAMKIRKSEIVGVQQVFAKVLATRQISSQQFLLKGDPRDVLLDLADRVKADCILVGARGLGKFSSLLGSVSSYITANAQVPTVVVKKPKVQKQKPIASPSLAPAHATLQPEDLSLRRTSTAATTYSVVSFTPSVRSHVDWSSVKQSFLDKLKEKFGKKKEKTINKDDIVVQPMDITVEAPTGTSA